ncbi:MAG: SUMF1/EgtB/PvdO family nonheme iron enzyme [bacterium]|nr:SUMF1/EgtB/PvdO family nonheme iron enzyme [bacterium]
MVLIPAGTFSMGSDATTELPYNNNLNQQPVHDVTISQDFWMGEHEVTQAEYSALMGSNPSAFSGSNLPVEQVSWSDAVAYCTALTEQEMALGNLPPGYEYRLPTEAEWEYACRAGAATEFAFGAELNCAGARFDYSLHSDSSCGISSAAGTIDVGSYSPNAFGLYDMHGNVFEWCLDAYSSYSSVAVSDPFVPGGLGRVFRGGSWAHSSDVCRSAARFVSSPGNANDRVGFRVVLASDYPQRIAGMVLIPGGTFTMGSDAADVPPYNNSLEQQPVHEVTISQDFWMGEHEVTQAEYSALMGSNPSGFFGANLPVEKVSWDDAVAYCTALTAQELALGNLPTGSEYRLPTEAEWEYACRAGKTTEFNVGAELFCEDARFDYSLHSDSSCGINSAAGTIDVGSYPVNGYGLYDMHGNVMEWCLDTYSPYSAEAVIDPLVTDGSGRVFRGGSWAHSSDVCRSAARFTVISSNSNDRVGFRVVLALVSPPQTVSGMVLIPAGTFNMGSNASYCYPYYNSSRQKPVHEVTISQDFWMGEHEVTQAEYSALIGSNPSCFSGVNLPVERVSWNDAVAYCTALTAQEMALGNLPTGYEYRLPTEAEWEYACRAGTTTEFNVGDDLQCADARFWYSNHGFNWCGISCAAQTIDVGSYAANAFGLYDMHGNVSEWCLDTFSYYSAGAVTDPLVTGGWGQIVRGGSARSNSAHCRSAFRRRKSAQRSSSGIGFRAVLAPVLVP